MGDTRGQTAYRLILNIVMAMTLVGALVGAVMLITQTRDTHRAPGVEYAVGPGPGVVTLLPIDEVGERPFTVPVAVDLDIDPIRLVLPPRNAISAESASRRGSTADLLIANELSHRLAESRDSRARVEIDRIREVAELVLGVEGTVSDLFDTDGDGFDDDGRFTVTALDGSAVCVTVGGRRRLATALSLSIDPIDDRPSTGISWTSHGPCGLSTLPPIGSEVRVGTTPGTFGGVRSGEVCDAGQLVAQLEANPLVARSWAVVQAIEPGSIGEYVDSLTSVILLRDTLITDHGFDNGRIHTRQVVLQRGTAAMVDPTGQLRVRCISGSPLRPPQATMTESVIVVGDPWRGFTIGAIADIPAAEVTTEAFVLVDIRSGQPLVRETGDGDAPKIVAGPLVSALEG